MESSSIGYLSHIRKRTKIALQRDSSMSREAAIFSLDDSFIKVLIPFPFVVTAQIREE